MDEDYSTRNITSADANTTVAVVGAGTTKVPHKFGFMTILGDSAHTIAFYDGDPTAGGTLLGTKPASTAAGTYWFKRPIVKGLYAVVAASFAGNIVIGYK